MKHAGSGVGLTDRVRMLRRPGEPEQLDLVEGRLGESAEFSEAVDHPEATPDRYWDGATPKALVGPVGGQHRKAIGGQLDRALEIAPELVRLRKVGHDMDSE